MNVAHAPFLFLFNLFFLPSFILTIQSQLSPSLCVPSAFSFIWTLVEFARVQSVRGVDLTPRRIIYSNSPR
ncbi:hypothetical protein C8F04DRAFT_1165109 [Mycena alexandri]|uniref:Uncharacterized protein n=1 Tax=Mycena alexandri TaxID=1745969 RepID=A0AAD6RWJ4_9AGAR|nr:hypothetical protein C8F04DRAFT_1165109 [Mycena alexandri]